MQEPKPESGHTPWPWLVILAAAAWSAWGALHPFSGDTANSRMATVYALMHHGTWQIDGEGQPNPYESGTVDKVRVEGKMYSSKPPVMPLMMTGIYAALRATGTFDLDREEDRLPLLKIQTLLLVTLPFTLAGIAFLVALRSFGLNEHLVTLGVVALMWGTEFAGYAGTLNNHVPATGALLVALGVYRGVGDAKDVQTGIWCLLAGMALGLAVTIDLPLAVFVLLLASAFLLKYSPRNVALGIVGALIPVGVHCAIMMMLHGSPMPFQTNGEYYLYEESYWRDPYGIDGLNHPLGLYMFNMTIGRVGVFLMYPVVALGFIALLAGMVKGEDRLWSASVTGAFAMLFFYYLLTTNNYGGASYGFRWLIVIAPFFLLALMQQLKRVQSPMVLGIVWFAVAVSVFSAWHCRLHVWSVNQEWPQRFFGPLV